MHTLSKTSVRILVTLGLALLAIPSPSFARKSLLKNYGYEGLKARVQKSETLEVKKPDVEVSSNITFDMRGRQYALVTNTYAEGDQKASLPERLNENIVEKRNDLNLIQTRKENLKQPLTVVQDKKSSRLEVLSGNLVLHLNPKVDVETMAEEFNLRILKNSSGRVEVSSAITDGSDQVELLSKLQMDSRVRWAEFEFIRN